MAVHNTSTIAGGDAVADRLAAALRAGLPVIERRMEVSGVSTSMMEGGSGAPVVLLHGQGAFAESWGPVLPRLASSHQLLVPDLPGLGRSRILAGEPGGERTVAWLAELIERTCNEPPVLVGISLGGAVAAHFAVQHGRLARRIVLIDPGAIGPFRPALGAMVALVRYIRKPTAAGFVRFGRFALAHPESLGADGGPPAAFVEYHVNRASDPGVRRANRRMVRWSMRPISDERLGTIKTPVALIWGRDDRIMRFRNGRRASERLGWPLYALDDCGHVPFVDQPAAFSEALQRAMTE